MKKVYVLGGIVILALVGIILLVKNNSVSSTGNALTEKIYVAVEEEGTINVIDPATNKSIKVIELTEQETGTKYLPHNVQASPDGKSIWVTANAGMEDHASLFVSTAHADEGHGEMNMDVGDQVIVIDPQEDSIIKRIPLGAGQHLAHIVFTPDGATALIAAQETNKLYKVDTGNFLQTEISLPEGSGPHGMRLSPDGRTAYVAFMDGKGLGIVDLTSGTTEVKPLNGSAVQTAVTPDGKNVATSVYETRSIALYDTALESVSYVALPEGSQGPVQLYPTTDSRFIYVADQGVLQNRPANNKLYKLDLQTKEVTESITVGKAPHGVVINDDNSKAYVTNLEGSTVSVVDTETGKEVTQISVGSKPNGISIWKGQSIAEDKTALMGEEMTVYKTKTCGCCHVYVEYVEREDVKVKAIDVVDLTAIKDQYGVPTNLQSCHTSIVGGYVVEGHIPLEVVEKLLAEKPAIKGIALPGMPSGSPGMPGPKTEKWTIYAIGNDGEVTEFMSY
jgi:YVTN family beta-propeller protein